MPDIPIDSTMLRNVERIEEFVLREAATWPVEARQILMIKLSRAFREDLSKLRDPRAILP